MLFLKVFPFKLFGVDLVEIGGEKTFSGVSKEGNEFPFRVLCLVLLLFIVVYVFICKVLGNVHASNQG